MPLFLTAVGLREQPTYELDEHRYSIIGELLAELDRIDANDLERAVVTALLRGPEGYLGQSLRQVGFVQAERLQQQLPRRGREPRRPVVREQQAEIVRGGPRGRVAAAGRPPCRAGPAPRGPGRAGRRRGGA